MYKDIDRACLCVGVFEVEDAVDHNEGLIIWKTIH